jgi:flavin reductase (DIM6/NTAB) family NADH-FMN oxidoreductase RutF
MPETAREPGRRPARRTFDDRALRGALGRFTTGVIILTAGPARAPHAMTANAFMSGSLDPPLVVVSVGRKARMHDRLAAGRRFGVSILDGDQEPASRHFAGQPQDRFEPEFRVLAGVPVLTRAAVVMAARIAHRYDCGDHTLFVGEIQALVIDDAAPPLVYYNGRYRALQPPPAAPGGDPEWYPSFF